MKRILIPILLCLTAIVGVAVAQNTSLNNEIEANLPSGRPDLLTATALRGVLHDIVNTIQFVTQPLGTNNTTAATTAFVQNSIVNFVSNAGSITSGRCAQWTSTTTIGAAPAPCAAGGSVTSVAATVPTGFAISGSPITGAGTLAITLSGTIPSTSLPTPTASTLGGVESAAGGTNQFMTGINTSGVPQFATPAGAGNVSTSGTITSGDCAQWNSTTTLISTSVPCVAGPAGSNGQVQYNNAGAFGALTNTQLTADINLFTSALSGAVPASGGGTTTFLRADGTFATPAGGGNVSTSGTITNGNCAQWVTGTTIQSVAAPCAAPGGSINQVQTNSGGGSFSGITNTQLTSFIGLFTSSLSGAVPASGGGTTTFMRADGTWAVPPATSPGGSNNQVQVNFGGVFGGLSNAQLTADINVFTAALSGATPAGGTSTTFLRGDGTWQTPSGAGNVSTSGTITSGNCAQFNGSTTLISASAPCGSGGGGTSLGYINIQTYGATGDGTCHQLSSAYANLAAAQAVYPFVSDMTQCIDWAAIQQAINVSYNTAPLINGSFPVYCPVGTYMMSNPIILDVPTNGIAGNASAWVSTTTYGNGAAVRYNGIPWMSVGSGNVGNPPTAFDFQPAAMNIANGGGMPPNFPWANVQISNASPAVVTVLTNTGAGLGASSLGVSANQPIVFFTQEFANPNGGGTPVLPTGINANQVYYVIGSSISGASFQVSTTPGGSAVNTTSAGIGNFFATGQVWQLNLVQSGNDFSQRISFIGAEGGGGSSSGCIIKPSNNNDWTAPLMIMGPGNGNLLKNFNLYGNVAGVAGTQGSNGYRCTAPNGGGSGVSGPAQVGNDALAAIGLAEMSNGGGSDRTVFENIGISGFYVNHYVSYGTGGALADNNTWKKVSYNGACIGVLFQSTQSFVNTFYDSAVVNSTTGVYASTQAGVKAIGGDWSANGSLSAAFTISSTTNVGACGIFFTCITATISNPDNNLQAPMCSYSAGQPNNVQTKWLNAWPYASGCGYNTFMINTSQWGMIGMYIINYNPFTGAAVFGVPTSYAGIYEGTCCGSNFTTQVNAATTLYATEAVIIFYGNNQIDTNHIENFSTPTTLSCFCTQFFGGSRPVELRNIYINGEASIGSQACCNQAVNTRTYQFYAQQVIPYINTTIGDTVIDYMNGGANTASNNSPMDRVLIATTTNNYLEVRHSTGTNNGTISGGSNGNPNSPLFDFAQTSIGCVLTFCPPLINPGTNGQMSGGYFAMGGSALGAGLWDNGAALAPSSMFSANPANLDSTDIANRWRTNGWGQAPQWGVRPAPWVHPCILPSQATTLAAPPAITFISVLHDFLLPISGGTGYVVNDILTLTGGTFTTAGQVQVTAVSGGVITAVRLTNLGAYTAEPATQFGSTGGTGTGATFNAVGPIWYVNYNIPYPMLWGGHIYDACNYNDASFTGPKYAIKSTHLGYSYFQNLTTTNVPHLLWTMDGASPFIYMNYEALELMFPGLVFNLVSDGTGGCTAIGAQNFMVLETHPTLGYVKVVRVDNDGSNYVPSLAASGITCKNTTIGQASPVLVNPY